MSFFSLRTPSFPPIQLAIGVAIFATLAAIAVPTYATYVQRSRVLPALTQLSAFTVVMEQGYQNLGNYGSSGDCARQAPVIADFVITCSSTNAGQGFVATATGVGIAAGYVYTIDQSGNRATTAHPSGSLLANCWSLRAGSCDA